MHTTRLIKSLLVVSLLLCLSASSARAVDSETHLLNETLSLTGNCFKDDKDMIEDPGCPGGVHPPSPLANPISVTTDPHGNIYVASAGPTVSGIIDADGGRVDIFDPSGHYVTGLEMDGVKVIAVDASGHLYVAAQCSAPDACAKGEQKLMLLRFDPTMYVPAAGQISYEEPPIELPLKLTGFDGKQPVAYWGLAINPTNQHLFASNPFEIVEFGPALPDEPNVKLDEGIGASDLNPDGGTPTAAAIAVDAGHGLLYIIDNEGDGQVARAFQLAAPHDLVRTIDGSETPQGVMKSTLFGYGIASEEATGHVFVADFTNRVVHEFGGDGSYIGSFEHGFGGEFAYLSVDNSPISPNQGYLFIPSGRGVPGHLYAYKPNLPAQPPVVEAVSTSGIGEREAVLKATVNPEGNATHYTFEYTTQEAFDLEGFAGALNAGDGDLAAGISGAVVSAPLTGLSPGTKYRFRVRAESKCDPEEESVVCSDEAAGGFATFPLPLQGGSCENGELRTGPSVRLPDCRAFELVTPPDTGGHEPRGPVGPAGSVFGSPTVSAAGEAVGYRIEGGPIPGTPGIGGFNGDAYLGTRTSSGWQTVTQGPSGAQTPFGSPGGRSSDLGFVAWSFNGTSAGNSRVVRHPDGSFHLVGQGTLTDDQTPELHYIGPHGSHVIFSSDAKLVEEAPEAGKQAIYDRTADGILHLASLLPGDVSTTAGTTFAGRSDDGASVAFTVDGGPSPLYVRVDNAETVPGAPAGAIFAGFSAEGRYLFYVSTGNFFRFDVQSGETIEIAGSGDVTPVNIPSSGSGAYFVSSNKLTIEPNPNGTEAIEGQPNLYYWNGAENRVVATVTAEDVEGEAGEVGGSQFVAGFDEWMDKIRLADLGFNPTRSSEQGSTLLFRSRAQLTPYDAGGHAQIYRYDAGEETLICVSCNPTEAPADSDATLVTLSEGGSVGSLINRSALAANLSADGRRAFFETSDRLVVADVDGQQDVYEWEAEGKGSCRQPGGCLFLISSGQSAGSDYFFGASASGDDVVFSTSDLLSATDGDDTPSLYDARVGGGFAVPPGPAGECLGEACQPAATPPPPVAPASSIFQGAGNVRETAPPCRKGTRPKRTRGKTHCVKKSGKKSRKTKTQSHRPGRSAR